jgi:hypothetical protein
LIASPTWKNRKRRKKKKEKEKKQVTLSTINVWDPSRTFFLYAFLVGAVFRVKPAVAQPAKNVKDRDDLLPNVSTRIMQYARNATTPEGEKKKKKRKKRRKKKEEKKRKRKRKKKNAVPPFPQSTWNANAPVVTERSHWAKSGPARRISGMSPTEDNNWTWRQWQNCSL